VAHSIDLRERVLHFIRQGGSKTEAAQRFSVCRASIYVWLKTPSLKPKKPGPTGPTKYTSTHLVQLVNENPDAYLDELAVKLGVNPTTVGRRLKLLNISRKKNHAVQRTKRRSAQQI
jgi:transposase